MSPSLPHTTPNCSSNSSHTFAQLRRKLPIGSVACGRPTFAHKITHYHGLIPKSNYLPHSWTHPTYHPKPLPYPISRFATMHWTDRCTTGQKQVYLLTPMDRATLLHVKSTILHCPPSIITRQRASVDSKLLRNATTKHRI